MERLPARSKGVTETLAAAATEIPGDAEAAFADLYRQCRDDVYAYAAGLLRDRAAAEDVTAQAFERAYRRRRGFDPRRGTRRAWLFGIARNAALDDQGAEVAVRRAALKAAIASLAPRERELVALKFFAGLTNSEIAGVIGTSETNAGTRLHRVIEKLRRACDEVA
jgi:DNA-directed RNA polymerase specialized sigma24 family protein